MGIILRVHEGRNHEVRELVKNANVKDQLASMFVGALLSKRKALNVVIQVYFFGRIEL